MQRQLIAKRGEHPRRRLNRPSAIGERAVDVEHQVLQPEVLAGGNRHMQHQRTTIPGSARDEARGRPSNRVAPRP